MNFSRRILALLATLLLVLSACGDDDAGGTTTNDEKAAIVAGLTDKIVTESQGDNITFDQAQAACFASGVFDEFGAERMASAIDLEFEAFMAQASLDERRQVVDVMFGCVDFGEVLVGEFAGAVSADSAQCLADALTGAQTFRDAIANSFAPTAGDPFDDPAVAEELLPAMLGCLSADELVQLGNS